MKIVFLIIITTFFTINSFGQRGGGNSEIPSIPRSFLVATPTQRVTQFVCNSIPSNNCNRIQNNSFLPNTPSFDLEDPFNLNHVNNWQASHGTPQLYSTSTSTPYLNLPPPTGYSSYAALYTEWFGGASAPLLSEGVGSQIPALVTGTSYTLTFFENSYQFTPANGPTGIALTNTIDEVNIRLMHCADFNALQTNTYNPPIMPTVSQPIYCEKGITANSIWRKRSITFTATGNYDIIMIYANSALAGGVNNQYGLLLITGLQLTQNSMTVNVTNDPQNSCIKKIGLSCVQQGMTYTWIGPNQGQTLNGAVQNIDVSVSTNVGVWTLIVTSTTPITVSNNTCTTNNNNLNTTYTINLSSNCNSCIDLPLVQ